MKMSKLDKPIDKLIHDLKERAKELNCLYKVQELLSTPDINIDEICRGIIDILPPGWQYPDVCQAKIIYSGKTYQTPGFKEALWVQSADVIVQEEKVGVISIYYTEERPASDEGPFLKEERKLINTIAEQFGFYILHEQLRRVFEQQLKTEEERKGEWWVILDLLKRTDPALLTHISRKMINFLGWSGIKEAEQLLEHFSPAFQEGGEFQNGNRPFQQIESDHLLELSDEVFSVARKHLSKEVILDNIQKWIKEDRSGFLVNALANPGASLAEICSSIERYHLLSAQGIELTSPREKWFRVSLTRRILSETPQFLEVAKNFLDIDDFSEFSRRVIYHVGSHGQLGGKSSGLFLAGQILKKAPGEDELLRNVKTPKTWYLSSDAIFYFMSYNNLEDIIEQKYKDLSQVRQEYPYIIHVFKNSPLPPEIIKGLSLALDDFGDMPLIVRSSSKLEDQTGAAFAGKYKSLFIANEGTKEERLGVLLDAITEVFASMFGPDPLEYRFRHDLVDQKEEMGILIQEVVGRRVGRYYFPAFAGVAFSENEFPWSSRIKREDGLIRIVPGLGTRAVDRLSDDYPVMIAPGQPGLRVNVSLDEIIRYSPKKIDVINLETRSFETIDIGELLKEYGHEYPIVNQLVSVLVQDHIQLPSPLGVDFKNENLVVTFEGLITRTPFLDQMKTILSTLQQAMNRPVDIEFAHDGTNFYLLQCRSQSSGKDRQPAQIPQDIPNERVIFSANRYVPNDNIPDITHIVYVDPQKYDELESYQDLVAVGRAVGRLNQILPKRQFILMGPGRWGSRGNIKLGVNVTYSDINNTVMLIEISRKQKDYLPEPSFGTHFFQDLIEAAIRYLPLYPDDAGVLFNEEFLIGQKNLLADLLPDYAYLADVLRVIDVPNSSGGQVLQVLMNASENEAVAILSRPKGFVELESQKYNWHSRPERTDEHWRWRLQTAENIAAQLDPDRFGVKAFYLFGSTKNATAGPQSDIDILIHFQGTEDQRKGLLNWLDGWSLCLSQENYRRTGYESNGLLDVHLITDEDLLNRTSYAAKIKATTDPARLIAAYQARPVRA
jgi:pyruvate,water dikinase